MSRLRRYAEAPLRRPLCILGPAALGLLAGLACGALLPPSFRASVEVQAEWDRPEAGSSLRLPDEASRRVQRIRQRLESPALIERAISQAAVASPAQVQAVRDAVEVRVGDEGTYLVDYVHPDAVKAALVANRLANVLVEEVDRELASNSRPDAGLLWARLLEARMSMDEKEAQLLRLRQEAGSVSGGSTATPSALLQVEEEKSAVAIDLATARVRAERLRGAIEPVPQPAPADTSGPAAELARLRAEREELRKRYTNAHPDVEALDRRVREAEAAILAAPASVPGVAPPRERSALVGVETEIRALLARDARLQAEAAKVRGRAQPAGRAKEDSDRLELEAKRARDAYLALRAERRANETASLLGRGGPTRLRVLQGARTPESPYFPDRRLLAVIGLSLGLALGLGAVLVRELRDRTVKDPEDLQELLAMPLLATLPLVRVPWLRLPSARAEGLLRHGRGDADRLRSCPTASSRARAV